MIDNYHLPRENATFRFVIWHGHLWGGRFQMAGVGYRQFKARLAHLHHLTAGDFAVILRKRQMLEKRRSAELLLTWLPLW